MCENTESLFYYQDFFLQNDEMLEIYSFEELEEFSLNLNTFLLELKEWNLNWKETNSWMDMNESEKRDFCANLFDKLDMCDSQARIRSLRCLLYLVQGCPMLGSVEKLREIQKSNTIRLYQMDVLSIIMQQLNFEISKRKPAKGILTIDDNVELRLILTIMYLITEVFYLEQENKDSLYQPIVDSFVNEISYPLFDEELISTKLWNMIDDYVEKDYCHYPLKKIILLLLKITVVSLGGFQEIDALKNEYRKIYGLKVADNLTDSEKFVSKCKQDYEYLAKLGTRKSYPSVARKFLAAAVKKYCHYEQESSIDIHNVRNNLYGLPNTVEENFQVLRQNLYISLADIHHQQEENFLKHPLTQPYKNQNPKTEILYSHLITRLSSYFKSLLKILYKCMKMYRNPDKKLTAALHEALRQEDIIMYSTLIITILYLKHFKLNNVYQFEYLSQIIENMGFILVSTNFFNSNNIMQYVCGIPYETDLYLDNQIMSSKRRMTIVLTILQILSKLTKWKPYRIKKYIKYLSVNAFQRLLSQIQNPIMEYHLLKLIKMQIKFLGKKWKNSNLKLISDIYMRLNLFLNDDYSMTEPNPILDTLNKKEELALKHRIQQFNQKHYLPNDKDFMEDDNDHIYYQQQLNEDFKLNYELWLKNQVYNINFEWDQLILAVE